MKVQVLISAQQDLSNGYNFYERQRNWDEISGIGDYFYNSLDSDITMLGRAAGIHSKRGKLFRTKSKIFPYWIYYQLADAVIYVRAVLDARQNSLKTN